MKLNNHWEIVHVKQIHFISFVFNILIQHSIKYIEHKKVTCITYFEKVKDVTGHLKQVI